MMMIFSKIELNYCDNPVEVKWKRAKEILANSYDVKTITLNPDHEDFKDFDFLKTYCLQHDGFEYRGCKPELTEDGIYFDLMKASVIVMIKDD